MKKCKGQKPKFKSVNLSGLHYSEKDLSKIVNLDDEDTSLINKCKYYEPESIGQLAGNQYKLRVLHLNINGLVEKMSELKNLLHVLKESKCQIDILLICETHLNDKIIPFSNIGIDGYNMIENHRKMNKIQGEVSVFMLVKV